MSLRDLAVIATVFGLLPFCLVRPWVGILTWSWLLLGGPAEVFLVKVDFRQKPVQGWKIFSPQTDLIELLKGFIQHLQSQTELCVEERVDPMVWIASQDPLIDTKEGAWVFPAEIESSSSRRMKMRDLNRAKLFPQTLPAEAHFPCRR